MFSQCLGFGAWASGFRVRVWGLVLWLRFRRAGQGGGRVIALCIFSFRVSGFRGLGFSLSAGRWSDGPKPRALQTKQAV